MKFDYEERKISFETIDFENDKYFEDILDFVQECQSNLRKKYEMQEDLRRI